MVPIFPHYVPGIAQQWFTHFQWLIAVDCWQACLMHMQNVASLFCRKEQDFFE